MTITYRDVQSASERVATHLRPVALSEACANAVEHGGRTMAHDGSTVSGAVGGFRVTAYLDGEKCRIEVTDSGPGFPPSGHDRPISRPGADAEHGRGLCLIQEIADHASFDNKPGRSGAVVSFDKILKWREGAALPMAS